jgi:hypothetical protein
MVEPQPSKLVMRVRFPSSALMVPGLVKALIRVFEADFAGRLIAFRAINGRLADRHQGGTIPSRREPGLPGQQNQLQGTVESTRHLTTGYVSMLEASICSAPNRLSYQTNGV